MFNFFKSIEQYKISKTTARIIFATPLIATILIGTLIIITATRGFALSLLVENSPVELLTFAFFLIGGVFGIYFVLNIYKTTENYISVFYMFFSICLIVLAMEEVAWGQWFFHFETPTEWAKINEQGETTLHNLKGMQGHTEILRLIYGLAGLIGILLSNISTLKKISVPKILILWYAIISIHASIDVYNDIVKINEDFDHGMTSTSEFIELLIAGSSFLYLWLNFKVIRKKQPV